MKLKGLFVFLLGAGIGSAATYYICQRNKNKEIEALMEKEWGERIEKNAEKAIEEYTKESVIAPMVDNSEETEESIEEAIIRNSVLTESPEKPDLFDYAKISLSKKREDPPAERSHDPVDDATPPAEFKMRKVDVSEFEELTYSYDNEELFLYQDGYVTNYGDEVIYMLKDMYPDASIDDMDESGHIYVAADYAMKVYDVNVVQFDYKDKYPDDQEE